jgi:hypothetical protein
MHEKLEALDFYRYVQELLNSGGIEYVIVRLCPPDGKDEIAYMEVVGIQQKHTKERKK